MYFTLNLNVYLHVMAKRRIEHARNFARGRDLWAIMHEVSKMLSAFRIVKVLKMYLSEMCLTEIVDSGSIEKHFNRPLYDQLKKKLSDLEIQACHLRIVELFL